jgi:hypothetical protein
MDAGLYLYDRYADLMSCDKTTAVTREPAEIVSASGYQPVFFYFLSIRRTMQITRW